MPVWGGSLRHADISLSPELNVSENDNRQRLFEPQEDEEHKAGSSDNSSSSGNFCYSLGRRNGRVVEGGGLENR